MVGAFYRENLGDTYSLVVCSSDLFFGSSYYVSYTGVHVYGNEILAL